MFIQSCDTTINQGIDQKKIISEIKEYLIRHDYKDSDSQFIKIQTELHDDFLVLGLAEGPHIQPKPFDTPIQFNHGDDTFTIVDMRNSTRWDRVENRPVINNANVFKRDVIRTLLEATWTTDGPQDILNLGHYQTLTFSLWISEMIARRFALDAGQQVKIQLICAFYYLCLFSTEARFDPRRATMIISKATRYHADYILEHIGELGYISNLEALIKTIIDQVQTERLAGFDIQVLIALLSGSWFGPQHSILVGIALEYPPVWVTLLYLGLTDRATRVSGIAKLALRKERDPITREFVSITGRFLIQESEISTDDVKRGLR